MRISPKPWNLFLKFFFSFFHLQPFSAISLQKFLTADFPWEQIPHYQNKKKILARENRYFPDVWVLFTVIEHA
tara:strand:+ start:1295 stop:1513 length:219 start_codon:yes stop_codon:yes gene_type:complete